MISLAYRCLMQWNGSEYGREDEPEPEPEPEPVGGSAGCAASGRAVVRAFCSQFVPASAVWLPAYRWREQLKPDIVAGVTLTIMGLPQGQPHECPRPVLRRPDDLKKCSSFGQAWPTRRSWAWTPCTVSSQCAARLSLASGLHSSKNGQRADR